MTNVTDLADRSYNKSGLLLQSSTQTFDNIGTYTIETDLQNRSYTAQNLLSTSKTSVWEKDTAGSVTVGTLLDHKTEVYTTITKYNATLGLVAQMTTTTTDNGAKRYRNGTQLMELWDGMLCRLLVL